MPITPTGPCEGFAVLTDIPAASVCRQQTSGDNGATDTQIEELIEEATDIVWVLLARPPVGLCTSTIYPCRNGSGWILGAAVPLQSVIGQLTSYRGCPPDEVKLDAPVDSITSVTIAGAVEPAADYRLRDGRFLVRSSGASWPSGSLTSLTAFVITYVHGEAVPPLLRDAVVELVDELWKEIQGIPSVLPPTTKSVNRQGVGFGLEDRVEQTRSAGPRLPKIVKAMSVYNPGNERFPSTVRSPDEDFTSHTVRTFS